MCEMRKKNAEMEGSTTISDTDDGSEKSIDLGSPDENIWKKNKRSTGSGEDEGSQGSTDIYLEDEDGRKTVVGYWCGNEWCGYKHRGCERLLKSIN